MSLGLRVPGRGAEAEIVDTSGEKVELANQRVLVELDTWAEVLFRLSGPSAGRVPVEVYHPDAEEDVEPCRLEALFDVQAHGPGPDGAGLVADRAWHTAIEDDGHRKVLLHLEQFGSVTEEQAMHMLGNARVVRRFSAKLDAYRPLLPFQVMLEVTASGNRYVKGN